MNTKIYQNKKVTTAVDSNSKTDGMNIGNSNTYQSHFLIAAGSVLTLLVLIALAGKGGVQQLSSIAYEMDDGTGALADYQVVTTNLARTEDIFGMHAVSENEDSNGKICNRIKKLVWSSFIFCFIGICCLTTCITFLFLLSF